MGRKETADTDWSGVWDKRPVVAIRPDGTIFGRFPSIAAAARQLGRRSNAVSLACNGHRRLCRGLKLMFADDYVPWADYHFRPYRNRDTDGKFLPGCSAPHRPTEAQRRRLSERAKARWADRTDRFGLAQKARPVICVETGERFPTMEAAAMRFGIPKGSQISKAIKKGHKCYGLTFRPTDNNQ